MFTHVAGRTCRSLNGRWRAIVDPYEAGYRSVQGDPWELGFFRNLPPRPGIAEYDFERAARLDVPGDWNSQREQLLFYEGSIWYKTDFEAAPRAGARLFLHFGAANYEARVYLNGKKLGEHEGGFTPFAFEITDRVEADGNFLIVQVDNTRRAEAVPTRSTDWWNYGGLTRDVNLVELPETFIETSFLRLADDGRVHGFVQLRGRAPEQSLSLRIREANVELELRADADGRAGFAFDASSLVRWSPENPKLYDVELESETDRLCERIGFRSLATRGCDILLNGEPVFLRGISIHEEAPTRPGRAFSEDDARTLLGWAKQLGCNFVRLAHYPHNEHMVRVADELGLLVWAEIPVYWGIAFDREDTFARAERQLREMIERDRNRASVALWSLANETPQTPERLAFLAALARRARALDPSRLVTAALMARAVGERSMVLDDPLAEHLDVMGCNEYLGWYYGDPDTLPEWRWTTPHAKPLIVSEFGAGALQGHRGDRGTPFTEEHQAHVYENQLRMLEEIPFLRGLSPWILKDFRSPRRVLAGIQDYWNRKGLISDRGQRKLAFEVLQRFYRARS
ncbi:MAG: beta-glucuronidase [Deltaproteobacteria bacterium]|nr:MAG: beta-glucuronidase [Deltaproteobacteria bacterium]